MNVNLSKLEIRRLIAALVKAEEWDEMDAQGTSGVDGKPNPGWARENSRAKRSQAANLKLQSKLRGMLKSKSR